MGRHRTVLDPKAAKVKYKADERARKRRNGLVRVEAWVLPDSAAEVRSIVDRDREIVLNKIARSGEDAVR